VSSPGQVLDLLRAFLLEAGLEWEDGVGEGELVVSLPGERKLKTVCSLVVGEHALTLLAFVIRNPDENHEAFYRHLLRRNLRLPGLAYAVDGAGDVYVTGRIPLAGVDESQLDQVLGAVLAAADEPFNELLALGFLSSMRREWAWRTSRGEPTKNLEAFRPLLEEAPEDDSEPAAPSAGSGRPERSG
jgi:Putative bacterial sensory transduction regulator